LLTAGFSAKTIVPPSGREEMKLALLLYRNQSIGWVAWSGQCENRRSASI